MTASRGLSGKIALFISVFGILVFALPINVFSEDSQPPPYLDQEDLKKLSQLRIRYQSASEEDKQSAQEFLGMATGFSENKNWGAAYKAYAESAAIKPTTAALEGMAISLSRISRERQNCVETLSSKARDFSEAFLYVAVALEFHNATKEKANLSHTYEELINAQHHFSGKLKECLNQ